MKNLVIAVSPDSSLDLFKPYADIVILDKDKIKYSAISYDTVYIRSHFSQPSTLPQNFRNEIDHLIKQARNKNSQVKFIDNMETVDKIVAFEDKWEQYKIFSEFMPKTYLYSNMPDASDLAHPIYKKRLSSRGSGVTWQKERIIGASNDWIVQESIDIKEELRIYIIIGEVYSVGVIKQRMTENNRAHGTSARTLTNDEQEFALNLIKKVPDLDVVGIDIARTSDGKLQLMEVNRSPGFARFYKIAGINLADVLYAKS